MHKAICAAALLAASAALAQAAPAAVRAPAQPKPAPELAQLKVFAAAYACAGRAEASLAAPAHATTGTFGGHTEADKFWLQVHYAEKKSKQNPLPQETDEHWSWDAAAKSFIRVVVDGLGGYGFLLAPGWEDGKLVFTGEYHLGPEKALYRETYAKEGADLVISAELQQGGAWTSLGGTRCKKTSK